ncbi:hypothetical protein C5167_021637 [Papaver somniferum]|uniref:UDP-glycosyltransferase 87A1-like n=1 Tax=Papaver somniferum TaxID=3469 RepID=UPI000E6FED4F|nr:UDP-glycosyltransferase 87A1-like [Papaver somniferum]RZC91925.1 hypothetical protein C5167_021637 [Papaver somniferum]
MEEILAGLRESGVRYLLASRDGYLTSIARGGGVGADDEIGVPMITFPFYFDQIPNRKLIVDDLKVGTKVTNEFGAKAVVKRDEVEKIVKKFMNINEAAEDNVSEAKEMRRRSSELKEMCRRALAKGGSSDTNMDAFIQEILQIHGNY